MPITVEMILIIIGILTPVLGGVAAIWRMIDKKVNTQVSDLKKEVDRLEKATARADEVATKRIEKLETNTVSRDDYLTDRQSMERAIENIALSLREGLNTVTQRVDLVLFEIGRNNGNKKD